MAQKIREIMTESPVCVSPDTDIATVAKRMRDDNIGSVLVTDGDNLRGMVTDRDLVVRGLADNAQARVGDICSRADAQIGPDDDVSAAVQLMREKAIRRLPVVDGGKPVGIISLGDLAMERDPNSGLADISAARPNN